MNPIDDGGPAFPAGVLEEKIKEFVNYPGKSLRDWFAGQALMGEMASQSADTGEYLTSTTDETLIKRATLLYRFADAMIAARNGGKS